MFKQAHSTRRRKRFHSLRHARSLSNSHFCSAKRERQGTVTDISFLQCRSTGIWKPSHASAESDLRANIIVNQASFWYNSLAKPRDSPLPEPSHYFPLLFPPCGSRMRKRFLSPLDVLASGGKTLHICFMTSRQFNVMNGSLMLPTQTRQWQNVVTYIHSYLIKHSQ